MKQSTCWISGVFIFLLIFNTCSPKDDFPRLEGPYLGQKPPGKTPEVFAPGLISTGDNDGLYTFLKGGTFCIFDRSSSEENRVYQTFFMQIKNGVWTKPVLTRFTKKKSDDTIPWLPDENSMLFSSAQSSKGIGKSDKGYNIWIVRLTDSGLSNPRMFFPPINSDYNDIFPTVTKNGTMYFFSNRDDNYTNEDIYRSRLVDGKYREVERLASPVNTENDEIDPFIACDESYLIYCSKTLEGFGGYDLYISFQRSDGSWTDPINMGEGINSSGYDWIPYVPPDGKYFFFNSDRAGSADVYWVDASIIEDLKPDELK